MHAFYKLRGPATSAAPRRLCRAPGSGWLLSSAPALRLSDLCLCLVFGLVVVAALSRGLCERVFKLPQVRLARLGLPAGLAGADLGEDLGEALSLIHI